MYEKVVQRLPVRGDPTFDLVAMVDHIEIELDLSTGKKSVRTRLLELIGAGGLSEQSVEVLLDAIRRLERIEELLRAHGFETARDTSQG